MSIKVKQLTKIYGIQKAVDDVSFEVSEGEILGFLGPNGAGKSTTMKITTGYLPPTSGTVEVCGYDVTQSPIKVQQNIGYLPEHNPLYLDMFVHEFLQFVGSIHGLKGKFLRERIKEMVDLCGLVVEQNKKIGTLSKGYRQRVGLAQALIHDPKVLILDEPTTGLDPNQIIEIRNLIKNISKHKTVIFSTHIMQEVQALCSRVIIINKGKIVADNEVNKISGEEVKQKILSVEFSEAIELDQLKGIEGVEDAQEVSPGNYLIATSIDIDIRPKVFQFASENQKVLLGMKLEEHTLEDAFRQLTK
jgi:ABC-2 type transport system ATP-binding protein